MSGGRAIELDRTRSVGEIVRAALDLYRSYPLLFLILAAAVMVPYELVVLALTGRGPLGHAHEGFVTLVLLSVLSFSLIGPTILASFMALTMAVLYFDLLAREKTGPQTRDRDEYQHVRT